MFEVRYRASLVRAMRVIRPGHPIRMCPTDPGAGLAQERPQWLHVFFAANDRRARNHNAAQQRRAKSVRRFVQVLNAPVLETDHVSLLSEQDRRVVREHLAKIQQPVTLLLFTQTIGAPETALIARQVLDELASLNDLIRVEESNFILEKDRASQYGVDRIPAIVLLSGENDTRMRFLGAPAGYEFMSLIEAVILAGTNDSQLEPDSRALIAANVTAPLDIQVFVTPT